MKCTAGVWKSQKRRTSFLSRIRPDKIRGTICYGFEDPYHTGQVLAGFALIYPWIGGAVTVCPDFEQRILKGDLYVRGKLRALHVVILAWKLIWCKEVRTTYRHIRSFE